MFETIQLDTLENDKSELSENGNIVIRETETTAESILSNQNRMIYPTEYLAICSMNVIILRLIYKLANMFSRVSKSNTEDDYVYFRGKTLFLKVVSLNKSL